MDACPVSNLVLLLQTKNRSSFFSQGAEPCTTKRGPAYHSFKVEFIFFIVSCLLAVAGLLFR